MTVSILQWARESIEIRWNVLLFLLMAYELYSGNKRLLGKSSSQMQFIFETWSNFVVGIL